MTCISLLLVLIIRNSYNKEICFTILGNQVFQAEQMFSANLRKKIVDGLTLYRTTAPLANLFITFILNSFFQKPNQCTPWLSVLPQEITSCQKINVTYLYNLGNNSEATSLNSLHSNISDSSVGTWQSKLMLGWSWE